MRVLVHDTVGDARHNRSSYVTTQVGEHLERFSSEIQKVDVTLSREGHNAAEVTHCHLAACLGSLGVVVADARTSDDHTALNGALGRLVRGITRPVEKRQAKETAHVTAVALAAVADVP